LSKPYEIKTLDELEEFFSREKSMCAECSGIRPHFQEIVRVTFSRWVKEPFNGIVEANFPRYTSHTSATLRFKILYEQKLFNLAQKQIWRVYHTEWLKGLPERLGGLCFKGCQNLALKRFII